ncbi:YebC/PmpR family DNA-binding transcriptional regulator [Fundicoccus sp. Sow4_H7]|uniref:YebC/PmpR family DNA-binding transcriptional regulator n=1 Tax=Fundicoccus sp. Sow4_H7 TaxID=3438784 RepID=UPI003F929D5D
MAGHSKWNNIKQRKGKEDAKRGKIFAKLGRYIMVAARDGGGDPEFNPALRAAVEKAKAANMPNDNIDRAIKKGTGDLEGDSFEEITYEGYGPAGVAVFAQCLTDNRNRTGSEIRFAFDRGGGNLGQPGSVSFMFDRKGIIAIEKDDNIDEEELMLLAIELGAEDFTAEEEGYEILTEPTDFNQVRDGLADEGYEFAMAEVIFIPKTTVELTNEDDIKNMERLIELLEDNDDVQEVFHNWEMAETE